ncbi:F0F1 ATP synthase subunit delta [Sphingomonas nostoxanthinifaciens]|uniref:F0F1 ATP synthase subunit delta n=1 Tax=Sphingomonas nostoxanthinifaciens TaxID=2872652 RepID=UPI001CC1C407|nr:F0F1 ATP synthase subunit delta [Sphingomonas nostoxanthinifaciens]UAK23410.1 F0F1 ATP synthase subunit delta [Sphingomonas nostoxanthinifaciens]
MEHSGGIQASLSGRYATALFGLARDANQLDAVSQSLSTLRQALIESADLKRLVTSPLVNRKDAGKAITAVAGELGLDPATTSFLGVLAANQRLKAIESIIRDFNILVARHRGETSAEIVSAHPLDDGQIAALKTRLKSMVGSEVAVDLKVDPAILGGLVVRLGSRQIDGSIRTKLNALALAMKG